VTSPQWLRWLGRIPAGLRIAVICTAVGIALGTVGAHLTTTKVIGHDQSAGPILVSADQRTLASTVHSGCSEGTLDVDEGTSTVTVRLHLWPSVMIAPGTCAMQTFTATLKSPLGSRRLVDGVTHAELPSFDGAGILRPTYLPAGFIHRYDTASFPSETVGHATAGCVQLYTQNDSYDEAIWITQDIGGVWQPPDGVGSTPIVVRGHRGTAVPGEIEWAEDGQLFTIRSVTYAYATLSPQELVAIGDSLR
jgi:hypothetical protein